MKIKNVMLFTYDFPHKKTQDFALRLLCEGYQVDYIIGAPWRKLPISKSVFRSTPVNEGLIHPKKIAGALGARYVAYPHGSSETINFLKNNPVDLYIIAGARILPETVIEASYNKILNIHPGLLPENRGLDTLWWAIDQDIPLGLSAHFISAKIDKGSLIHREHLHLNADDDIRDVTLRLLEKQPDVLIKAMDILENGGATALKNLDFEKTSYYSKMDQDKESEAMLKFPQWLSKYADS